MNAFPPIDPLDDKKIDPDTADKENILLKFMEIGIGLFDPLIEFARSVLTAADQHIVGAKKNAADAASNALGGRKFKLH